MKISGETICQSWPPCSLCFNKCLVHCIVSIPWLRFCNPSPKKHFEVPSRSLNCAAYSYWLHAEANLSCALTFWTKRTLTWWSDIPSKLRISPWDSHQQQEHHHHHRFFLILVVGFVWRRFILEVNSELTMSCVWRLFSIVLLLSHLSRRDCLRLVTE